MSADEKKTLDLGPIQIVDMDVESDVVAWTADQYHANAKNLVDALVSQASAALRKQMAEAVAKAWSEAHDGAPIPPPVMH